MYSSLRLPPSYFFLIILTIVHLGNMSGSEEELGEASERKGGSLKFGLLQTSPYSLLCSGALRSPPGFCFAMVWGACAHARMCKCVCVHTRAHTGVQCRYFLSLSSAWCLYFILYAVPSVARTAFPCISFQFLLPGYLFATEKAPARLLLAAPRRTPAVPAGGALCPEAEMHLRSSQHRTRGLGSAVVSSSFLV